MTSTTTKKCYICHEYKDLDQFASNVSKPQGVRDECTACRSIESRVRHARDSARKVGSRADITIRELRDLMQFVSACIYCGKDISDADSADIHVDHIIASSKKGDSALGNLIPCCAKCSLSKSDKPAALFTDKISQLITFIAMEKGISREEAAIIILVDGLSSAGVENADQIAAAAVILDSIQIYEAASC